MSDLRVRCASWRSPGSLALLLLTLFFGVGCGAGEGARPAPPVGVELPEVGTLGRLPGGPGTIVVQVTADGRITMGDSDPLSLKALGEELTRQTADPRWREDDRSSLKILLIHADASLPWTVAQWILQTAADPTVALYRIFFGAREQDHGAVGALGCTLPKDRGCGHGEWIDPPPRLRVRVVPRDGTPSQPADLLAPLRIAAGERPISELWLNLAARGGESGEVPTGFMIRLVDVALRAGVGNIVFEGAPPSSRFEADDVQGLLDHVAELQRNLATPVLTVGGEVVGARPVSESVPSARGRLPHLRGARLEKEEPSPDGRTAVIPRRDWMEEELEEEPPEEDDEEFVIPEPVIKDAEFEDGLAEDGLVDTPFDGPPSTLTPLFRASPPQEPASKPRRSVEMALLWLAAHQAPNGGWEARGYGRWCDGKEVPEGDRVAGWGRVEHDVGATGLALCAFLGAGYTHRGQHAFAKTVSKGLRYLKNVQDAEGCFGPRTRGRFVYNHAVAALAMVEAYGRTGSPIYRGSARKALAFTLRCRNPGGGWRYGVRPGASDTSVTAWMALPLFAARWINQDAEGRGKALPLPFDVTVFDDIHAWIEDLTDPDTGRTGYQERGSRPDRPANAAVDFPAAESESTTAAGMLLRAFLGEDPRRSDALKKGAALLAALPPSRSQGRGRVDHVYWYLGTFAMHQIGGSPWKSWDAGLRDAVEGTQRTDTDVCRYLGSWDAVGVWGPEGGRVASTALMALSLELSHGGAGLPRPR